MEDKNDRTKIETEAQLQSFGLVLSITRKAWGKLMAYCCATNLEVSGFMVIERDEMDLTVVDCFIAHQVSTGTSTEMDSTSISRLQMELFRAGIIGKDNILLGHFHTHPTFGVFWSSTDMEMRKTLSKGTDFYISLVINQKGEALAAIDINGAFPMSITNLPINIMPDTEMFAAIKAEVADKVKEPVYERHYAGGGAQDWWELGGAGAAARAEIPKRKRGRPRKIKVGEDGIVEVQSPNEMSPEDKEALIGLIPEGGSYSDETGTWANIGGEIVNIDKPFS